MTGFLAALVGGGNTGVAAGLPAGQNLVEGTEASLMVGAAAANSSWRKAWVALGLALLTLAPFLAGIWFLYKYTPGEYIDYAVAVLIFGIGVHEVMEGLGDRPEKGTSRRVRLDGPLGIDPSDPAQIHSFQAEHGLDQDGVLGTHTRGAILAELAERGEEPRANRLGVDVTDEASVKAFQCRVGLPDDGVVGPRTRGALAAEAAPRELDPADPDGIRAFQRDRDLPETGIVDARTQGALRAVRLAERGGASATTATTGADGADGAARPGLVLVRAAYGVDLTNADAVRTFQEERGLPQSGVVDEMTQGALRAEIERRNRQLGLDPADAAAVRRFQAEHGLASTGVVDEETQEAIEKERASASLTSPAQRTVFGVDPTDASSIGRFQALHGLDETGVIDAGTGAALRRTEEWIVGIDPAQPDSVARFQVSVGLAPTGVVDAKTQEAMRRAVDERTRDAVAKANEDDGAKGFIATYKDAWPAYFGFLLEGGEAGLFTIGVAHGTGAWYTAAIAGGSAFMLPWIGLVTLRGWIESWPKWAFELTIGIILASAATIFGLFRATGIFGA